MQSDGAVIASLHLVANLAVTQAWQQTVRQHKVIEPPAHVLIAGVHHVGPEGVGVGLLGVELAEAVDETGFQQLAETLALFSGEACVLLVPLGVLQVDLLVCDVKVATQHHGLLYVQLAQVHPEVHVPGFAVIQAHKASARVWHIGSDQEEAGELRGDDAALLVVLLFAWRYGRRIRWELSDFNRIQRDTWFNNILEGFILFTVKIKGHGHIIDQYVPEIVTFRKTCVICITNTKL